MTQDEMKQAAAKAAIAYIQDDMIVGVGTGSTVNHFIDALAKIKGRIETSVASSIQSERLLKSHGIPVLSVNSASKIDIYVDGADEINHHRYMIKGGGGALTGEKIIAAIAKKFICIADQSKKVDILGSTFPLPIEVIPLARSYVAREIVKLGGDPVYREGFTTDYGNIILDVHNFKILEPLTMEQQLNNIAGVVTNGIFAHRPADVLLLATKSDIITL